MLLYGLELWVLGLLVDDYQSIDSLRRQAGRRETLIVDVLLTLHRNGMIKPYRFEAVSRTYQPVADDAQIDPLTLWFTATDKGRDAYDDSWRAPW